MLKLDFSIMPRICDPGNTSLSQSRCYESGAERAPLLLPHTLLTLFPGGFCRGRGCRVRRVVTGKECWEEKGLVDTLGRQLQDGAYSCCLSKPLGPAALSTDSQTVAAQQCPYG